MQFIHDKRFKITLYEYAGVHHEHDIYFAINQSRPKLIELFLSS